jgi:hypothetical protein
MVVNTHMYYLSIETHVLYFNLEDFKNEKKNELNNNVCI